MKNLKEGTKKLFFSILILSALVYIIIIKIESKDKEKEFKNKQELLYDSFSHKIDSISIINKKLEKCQIKLTKQLDSLYNEQRNLNRKYEKEIRSINNATLDDHGKWFVSKIDSIISSSK